MQQASPKMEACDLRPGSRVPRGLGAFFAAKTLLMLRAVLLRCQLCLLAAASWDRPIVSVRAHARVIVV